MSLPAFTFEVGFASPPLATSPAFTDLASDLESLSVSRGRQTDDDAASTGTATGVLNDDARKYDPNNTAGAYYPNVQPMKPVRIRATLDGVTYAVFYGWIDVQTGWIRAESEPARAVVTVPCNDGFEILANGRVFTRAAAGFWLAGTAGASEAGTTTIAAYPDIPTVATPGCDLPQELTGSRIANLLGMTSGAFVIGQVPSWPADWRNLDAGLATVQAQLATDNASTDPLSLIHAAETTEPGFFFFAKNGYATFKNRRSRLLATSAATFCDSHNLTGGRILYDSITTRRTVVVNVAQVTRNGGTQQEYVDSASQTALMSRAKSYSTLHLDDATALEMAKWVVGQKKDSYEVLESLTLVPGTDSPTWVQVLSRELGDRITVVRTPPGGGASSTLDYFIEKIDLTWGPGPDAKCTWRLTPATQFNYWLAGTAGSSEAGTTTRAAY